MSERKAGYYMIRYAHEQAAWEPAEWDGERWILLGNGGSFSAATIGEIGPRIPTPDEPASAYLQAADEMRVVACIGTAEPDDDLDTAKRKLGELIDWHVSVALDERINGGYRLVPVEPTPLMASVAKDHIEAGHDAAIIWRAMLMYAPRRGMYDRP